MMQLPIKIHTVFCINEAANESGFTACAGGEKYEDGRFYDL